MKIWAIADLHLEFEPILFESTEWVGGVFYFYIDGTLEQFSTHRISCVIISVHKLFKEPK